MQPAPDAAKPSSRWLQPGLALPEGLEAGLIGGLAVVLVYGAWDLLLGEPLRTPSVLGNLLLYGGAGGSEPTGDTAAAVTYHVAHFAAWTAIGFAASWVFTRARESEAASWLLRVGTIGAVLVLVALDGAVHGSGLSRLHLWAGGLAGLASMGAFLTWRHPKRSS
jgi:hypothetical protein